MKPRLFAAAALLATVLISGLGQQARPPITERGLIQSLRERGSAKLLLGEVKARGVEFQLTQSVERKIRGNGAYLGKKVLEMLIVTIRENYRESKGQPVASPQPPSPSPSPRFFADITPRELVEPYLQKNPVQADVAVAGYKGKWLKVDVEVAGIADLFGKLQLQGPDAEGAKLLLSFDRERYMAEFASFRAGQHLSVSCVFDQVLLGQVLLDNCEINKPDSPPIRTKSKPPSLL